MKSRSSADMAAAVCRLAKEIEERGMEFAGCNVAVAEALALLLAETAIACEMSEDRVAGLIHDYMRAFEKTDADEVRQ